MLVRKYKVQVEILSGLGRGRSSAACVAFTRRRTATASRSSGTCRLFPDFVPLRIIAAAPATRSAFFARVDASDAAEKAERAAGAPAVVLKGTRKEPASATRSGRSYFSPPRPTPQEAAARKPGEYFNLDFVFSDKHQTQYKLDAPTKAFREIADLVELPPEVSLHSLRHSFASWSIASGGIVAVQRCRR